MQKLLFAGLLSMGLLFLACSRSGGDDATTEEYTSVDNKQFGKAIWSSAKKRTYFPISQSI